MNDHKAIQYSDEMQCARCGKAWDVNDPDPPPCLTPRERSQKAASKWLPRIKEILRR